MKLKIILCLLFISGIFFVNEEKGYACSCAQPSSVQSELENKTAIFSGKVLKIIENSKKEALIEVNQIWKGPSQSQLIIETERDSAGCGFDFIEGQTYLIYAYGEKNTLETGLCERTALVTDAGDDIRVLGAGKEPEKQVNLEHQLDSNRLMGVIVFAVTFILIFIIVYKRKK
ncbi:hypothetical protein M4D55_18215 [Metabacillus idriensis]|uniref:hypothetical protein n=1 Tax=Metabacillus idriensis TaxID=324768 RepID=UPI0008A8DB30|nr:hypothetical protein [Metabacillus idriensis]MCM3597706.1 hypothetical protein [Metabacillus idriensis]OHR69181.1 hypothetical protein HMPREF3291_08030 [Bacillus sp. HMSC76G11]